MKRTLLLLGAVLGAIAIARLWPRGQAAPRSAPRPPAIPDRVKLGLLLDVRRAGHEGPEALARRQRERLRALVQFAREHSAYYRELYGELPNGVDDLSLLPPTSKRILMRRFDEWVTDPKVRWHDVQALMADINRLGERYLGRYLVYTTSGTSGEPAVLVQDGSALAVLNALRFARFQPKWLTPSMIVAMVQRGMRSAGIFATGGHYGAAALSAQTLRRSLARRLTTVIPAGTPIAQMVSTLNALQPAVLGGYASAVAVLAQEQQADRLHIQPVVIMTTAEGLTLGERERVRTAFGCLVKEAYAASEVPGLSLECSEGFLHANTDWYLLEPVDEGYRPVPPNQPSHTVLVTNLSNYVQPIIRYDLGDSITLLDGQCPCGNPFPRVRVEDRTDEVLHLPSTAGSTVGILPLALSSVVEEVPGVHRFQAIRTGERELTVRLALNEGADAATVWEGVRTALQHFLDAQGTATVTLTYSTEPPGLTPGGKFRHVWSEITAEPGSP